MHQKVLIHRVQGMTAPGYLNIRATNALGRVYIIHSNSFECFFLQLFLERYFGFGLLEDDTQWEATIQSPARLRNVFVILLLACGPSNPGKLWESYKESLTEDIPIQARRENPGLVLNYAPNMFNQKLMILEDKALEMAGKDIK